MTNKERVLVSIRHQQPDKTPYHIDFTHKAYQKMAEYYGDPGFAAKLSNCFTFLNTAPRNAWREVAPDIWADEFGVQWNRAVDKDIGVVVNCLVTPENLKDYKFPDPADPSRYANIPIVLKNQPQQFVVADIGFSLFERAWTLAGMEAILMGMVANPKFVHEFLDRILEYNLQIVEHACAHPLDGFRFGDDWGQQTGLIMGPALWREFIQPRIRQMYQRVKAKGKTVLIHSCGKVDEIFPDLIEAGLDVFNPFQPEVMDVYAMKKKYGDRLSFFGGISTQKTLPFGTVRQVQAEVRRLLEKVGQNGGYIAAPAHAIPADAKPENIAAMLAVLNNQ
jgi:uroporphyrinogen decarboxylase